MTGAMHANSPLAQALSSKIMPKLEEIGWAVGGDDSVPLSEYICLMLVNGKSQTQIAEELSGEHLGIADMDSAQNFAGWLFEQVEQLSKTHGATEGSGISAPVEAHQEQHQQHDEQQHHFDSMEGAHDEQTYDSTGDAEMGEHGDEQGDSSIPTGPKAMRQPNPRVFQQINKQMDRSSDPLRRARPMGGDRIAKSGDMPKGPRGSNFRQQQQNGRGRPPTNTLNNMNPHQRMQVFNNFDQQRGFPQPMMGPNGPFIPGPGGPQFQPMPGPGGPPGPGGFMPNGMPPFVPGPNGVPFNPAGFNNGGFYPNNGRPHHQQQRNFNQQHRNNGPTGHRNMFDMVEFPNRPNQQQGQGQQPPKEADDSQMEEDEAPNPAETPCRFAQRCGKADCPFAHPTPAAPPNRQVAISGEKCPFGVKCKNTKCTGSHPSPASAPKAPPMQLDIECRFFPNCKNPACPFKHPKMPPCRNGTNCTRPGCHFDHSGEAAEIPACRYHPCLNPNCKFTHEEGQQKKIDPNEQHVSERKFVIDESKEELIIPGSGLQGNNDGGAQSTDLTVKDAEGEAPAAAAGNEMKDIAE